MTIAIDARAAVRPELGGVERWARELCKRLPALRPGGYVVVRPPAALAHRAGHAWEQVVLPARARRLGARMLLCPANLAPLASGRAAVVVHDASVLRNDGWYSAPYAAWLRLVLGAVVRRADTLITVSEFSRRELVALAGADPARIAVVPGGVDERFQPGADPEPARRALGLDRPYVLCVASHTARKNLAALVPAARALAADGIDVVLAGGHRPQFRRAPVIDPEHDGRPPRGGALGGLRVLGAVPDDLLPGLYAGALAFALPSRYEGFGLPVIEAMAAGAPVVAADAGALPETCGGAAVLAEPEGEAFAAALTALVADEDERARLRAAGLARAAGFSWDATARAVDAVLYAQPAAGLGGSRWAPPAFLRSRR